LWQGIKQAVSSIGHAIMGAEFAYMSNNIPAMSIARFAIDATMDPADPNITAVRVGELVGDAVTFAQGLTEVTGGSALAVGSDGVLVVPGVAISVHGAALTVSSASHIAHTVYLMSDAAHDYKSTSGSSDEGYLDKDGLSNLPKKEKMSKKQIGDVPINNQAQNEQVRSLVKQYKLSKAQQQRLHRRISKQGYSRKKIESIIKEGDY
jgi:hypothetical protein